MDTKKILIVDDVEANRFILRNIIVDMGYQPILAENGIQALRIMERIVPNLILLDVSMPEMDGFEFCEIVKSKVSTREIPIIFISAFDSTEDIIKGFNLGGEDYVTKPFIQEVVKARVNVHLKLSDANADLANANHKLSVSIQEQLKQIEQEKKSILYALSNVAADNSFYEEGYMDRVASNCRILAQAMQLSNRYEQIISDTFIDTIELTAPLCDIGNVSVPTEILRKSKELTPEENEIIKTHTTIGARILSDMQPQGDYNDFVQMSQDIAKYHHECWDGTGYPEGISGDDIPLAAQIVSIVSMYCELTEKNEGRQALTAESAVEIMKDYADKKYSFDIYDIVKRIYRQFQ